MLDATDGMTDMLMHQDNVASQSTQSPLPQPRAVARVIPAGPSPARKPRPDSPPPNSNFAPAPGNASPPQRPPAPSVPAALYEGLNENLLGLLKEEPSDE